MRPLSYVIWAGDFANRSDDKVGGVPWARTVAKQALASLVTEAIVSTGVPTAEEALILPPQDSSAVRAQRFIRRVLAGYDVERDLVDVAVLMTKALVINGILHARSALAITVKVGPDSIRIEVTDRDRQMIPGVTRSWGTATISK